MPRTTAPALLLAVLGTTSPFTHAEPPEFTAVEITNWTAAQRESLGHFHRWVPATPQGAPADFAGAAHTRNGYTVGAVDVGGTFLQTYGYLDTPAATTTFQPLGTFNWQRVDFDGKDYHFYNGFVSFLDLFDVNCSGAVVGLTTVAGSGQYPYEHIVHAVVATPSGDIIDITPDAFRAEARGINAAGEIALWIDDGSLQAGFRRAPSGELTQLDGLGGLAYPADITNAGLIVGRATNGADPRSHAFASTAGAACIELPLPPTGSPTDALAVDANESGWVVGDTWDFTQAYEHFANIWIPSESGDGWDSFDLNELNQTGDILLERAVAIAEDGRVIAIGRPDGSDAFGSALYVLTPSVATPDPCAGGACAADLTGDAAVSATDLAVLIAAWGGPAADLDGDGATGASDLAALLAAWGPVGPCL